MSDTTKWQICDDQDVLNIAKELIDKHHQARCMIQMKDIGWLWNMQGYNDGTYAKCRRISDQMRIFFKDPVEFIIEIDFDKWQLMHDYQQVALIDHELMHIDYKENEKTGERTPCLRRHDFEEFVDIIHRHGAWNTVLNEVKDSLEKHK